MTLVQKILDITDRYCAARGVTEGTVGGIIFKNSRVFPRIRAGGDLTTSSYERALRWYRDNWPDGHPMPADIAELPILKRKKNATK